MKGRAACRLPLILVASLTTVTVLLLYVSARWDSDYRELRTDEIADADAVEFEQTSSGNRTHSQPVGGVRCGDLPKQYPDSIPPIVHWTSKDGRVAAKLQSLVQSWRSLLNSSSTIWRFMHWDDKQIAQLITNHYPQLETSYAKLVNGLERSDIGRLVVLHHVGGVYVDMDVELRRDLSPLLKPSLVLRNNSGGLRNQTCCTAIWAQEPLEHAIFSFGMDKLISNAVILSRANHSFLSFVLRSWPAWFESNWASKTGRHHGDAVHVTGPVMLHAFFERYLALPPGERPWDWSGTLLADPDMFQPIWDKVYMPGILRRECLGSRHISELKTQHCRRLAKSKFRTGATPARSFTVHRFMHLSYTNRMQLRNARHIYGLLPIHVCSDQ